MILLQEANKIFAKKSFPTPQPRVVPLTQVAHGSVLSPDLPPAGRSATPWDPHLPAT